MRRAQHSREFWEKVVAEADTSGLSRTVYAEKVGVGHAALSYWLTKLRSKAQEKPKRSGAHGARLVPVRVLQEQVPSGAGLTLQCGGLVLCFTESTSPEYIGKLAASLAKC